MQRKIVSDLLCFSVYFTYLYNVLSLVCGMRIKILGQCRRRLDLTGTGTRSVRWRTAAVGVTYIGSLFHCVWLQLAAGMIAALPTIEAVGSPAMISFVCAIYSGKKRGGGGAWGRVVRLWCQFLIPGTSWLLHLTMVEGVLVVLG